MLLLLILITALSQPSLASIEDHWAEREKILLLESQQSMGGHLKLKKKETEANRILMKYKEKEWQLGFQRPGEYPPNMHFFKGKPLIEQSKVYSIIQQMPKGVLLHTHDFGMVSFDYLLNLTYSENLYACIDNTSGLQFTFSQDIPTKQVCSSNSWQLLADMRKSPDLHVNCLIRKQLSLVVKHPHAEYKDIDAVWSKFMSIFMKVEPWLTYKPVFEKYFTQALKELNDDKIRFVQIRTTLPDLYDLDGKIYQGTAVVRAFKSVVENFKRKHPEFVGAKIIYAPPRSVTNETMSQYVEIFTTIKKAYKDFVLGFDLVGQEDPGTALKDFLEYLLPLKDKYKFFFHAGETDWYGSRTDENLIDAILLGTKRIGHGYALLKHPHLMEAVRDKGIAVEVSPISNQVLKLVEDVRNHPGAVFGATTTPMVVTNDDPSFWGSKGVSYDWYMAFMGIASRHSDLRYLKQLALNSILYSELDTDEQSRLMDDWQLEWDDFIETLANDSIQ